MQPERPNILMITSDQHRADTLGCAGHPIVQTPHLDALAFAGRRFTEAYVDCPVCIPARTTLITGREAHHNGMPDYAENFRVSRAREHFLGSLLTRAGYQTRLIGKTHWHTEPSCRAGFEHVEFMAELRQERLFAGGGRCGDLTGHGYNELSTGLSELPPALHSTTWCVDRAVKFLGLRERAQPFALWVSLVDPHPPLVIQEPYYSLYRDADLPAVVCPKWIGSEREPAAIYVQRHAWNPLPLREPELRRAREVYCGMVTHLDHQLGRLLGALALTGDLENTLIVYSSDHGEHLGDHGLVGKRTFLEASAKVPLIVRPPGDTAARVASGAGTTVSQLVQWADLLPTLADYAGAEIPSDVDGRSLRPLIEGNTAPTWRTALHGQLAGHHQWRTGDLKFLYDTADGRELVFDLAEDPREERPLDPADPRVAALRAEFIAHLADENHNDVRNGQLVNHRQPRPDAAALRARHLHIQGLSPAALFADLPCDKHKWN